MIRKFLLICLSLLPLASISFAATTALRSADTKSFRGTMLTSGHPTSIGDDLNETGTRR